ncbi:MAG: hypothetical protein Q7S32_00045 [bacterium]|nr:hypothetical protein [bacterium]
MDKYQKYGLFTLALSLFLMTIFSRGSERILYVSGILYSLVFLFHTPLEKIFSGIKRPLRAYGIAVVANGLIVETLAYFTNLDRIRAGEKAYLFATSRVAADIFMSLPYYIVLALIYTWAVKKYKFTTFSLGFIIWLFWAITVDEWVHLLQLFAGGLPGVVGFVLAGFIMLFTLHAPIVIFEKRIAEAYPSRLDTKLKYVYVFLLQNLSMIPPFVIGFIAYNILHL